LKANASLATCQHLPADSARSLTLQESDKIASFEAGRLEFLPATTPSRP
jgi:hypothetical protein